MKFIILCADDYGLNAWVSQGIIHLLEHKRLSAVSCLSSAPLWPQHAPWLKAYQAQADLGLHFNLTEGSPLSSIYRERYGLAFYPLSSLIYKTLLRRLDVTVLEQECQAQLDAFVAQIGRLPDFIDGHQHIHQLPQVRDAVLKVYERNFPDKKAYFRSVANPLPGNGLGSKVKQSIIRSLGSSRFQSLLKQKNIPHNVAFAGIYSFPQSGQYGQIFSKFLEKVETSALIMCHPGLKAEGELVDPIARARFQEYTYLSSSEFTKDCQALGIEVRKMPIS